MSATALLHYDHVGVSFQLAGFDDEVLNLIFGYLGRQPATYVVDSVLIVHYSICLSFARRMHNSSRRLAHGGRPHFREQLNSARALTDNGDL